VARNRPVELLLELRRRPGGRDRNETRRMP
jgi:hypothetical protein